MKTINQFIFNFNWLLIVVIVLLTGCRKDPEIEVKQNVVADCGCGFVCEDFPKSDSWLGYTTFSTGTQYLSPKFNPTNDNEFVYLRVDENWNNAELVKVDLTDMSEIVLLNTHYFSAEPIWNNDHWIVFSGINSQVWKMKDNGSDLTQLTFGNGAQNPYFNTDGSVIYYARSISYSNYELEANPELYKKSKIIGINLNGEPVDSILAPDIRNKPEGPFLYQKWLQADFSDHNVYFSWGLEDNFGIYCLDMLSNEIFTIDEWSRGIDNSSFVENVKYHDNFVYVSKFRNDLLKIDVNTGEHTRIQCGCDANYYNTLSISPDGDKMLVERIISTVLSEDEIDEQHEIWMMDLDGSNAVKILGDPE